jgi:hypothetical protein
MHPVERQRTTLGDCACDEELANLYEYLVLHDLTVPPDLVESMQAAYRAIHLRGLDPLRRVA